MSATEFFCDYFERLKGTKPYPWQQKLFEQIVAGSWPQIVDMPTGAGKTAVLWIWWLALAWSKQQRTNGIPIRLAWGVNRRVVVDQVSSEVNELCTEWAKVGFTPLLEAPAASTLRGQFADNGAWRSDPTAPAVIVGTVDMIASRLLFRGYRSGPYWRPVEAGLLGVDTLIVNDEAHLSPAFAALVGAVDGMRPAESISGKSFRYLLLSATQQGGEPSARFAHNPEEDAEQSARFRQVWMADKTLDLQQVANGPAVKEKIWKLATQEPAWRTVVFLDKPEDALAFYKRLTKDGFEAALMTGTMRGKEREELIESQAFVRFLKPEPGGMPVYLVATSAGEVGVNLTCERMITELCEAEHLIQRFGRLNRFGADGNGQPIKGKAFVVYVEPKKDSQARLKATIEYLQTLSGDVSPQALWAKRPPPEAVSLPPKTARLEKWRVESWAQTTYRDRDLPAVAPWIRGKEEERAQTEVAWRADLAYWLDWGISTEQIEKALEAFPVLTRERLQEPSSRVLEKLQEIGSKLEGKSDQILVVQTDQSVRWEKISKPLTEEDIRYCLLLLPKHMGRVEQHGMFEAELGANDFGANDFKDVATDGDRIRVAYKDGEGRELGASLNIPLPGGARTEIAEFAKTNGFRAPLILRCPDSSDDLLVYLTRRLERQKAVLQEVSLEKHQDDVARQAHDLARQAGLGQELSERYRESGSVHDEGKDHRIWQTAMGAKKPPAAKTEAAANLALLNGYRHEFGSLLKAKTTGVADDLVLHLIATHHKAGRPFFARGQFDPLRKEADCQEVAREAEQRFARLQQEFGPWGLAYLEAIFKRADGLASAGEGDGASD